MKARMVVVGIVMLLLWIGSVKAEDQETDKSVKEQLQEMKEIIEQQNMQIQRLEKKIGENNTLQIQNTKKLIKDANFPSSKNSWLPSIKNGKFELGGELEIEFKTAERDSNPAIRDRFDGFRQTFDLDKGNIYLKAKWNDVLSTFFEIEFFEDDAHIDTAWAQFDWIKNENNDFFIRAGLDHQFTKYSRTTENYPLAGASFWRDEFTQLRAHGHHSFDSDKKWFYWDAMIGNSYTVDKTDSAFGENHISINDLLQDDNDENLDLDGHLQWGLGIGVDPDFGKWGKLDLRTWYIASELRDEAPGFGVDEIADRFFASNGLPTHADPDTSKVLFPGLSGGADTDKNQLGLRLTYKNKFFKDSAFKGIFEYIDAKDGPVNRDTWYLEGSMKFKTGGFQMLTDEKWFTSVHPFVRYENYNVDNKYDNQLSEAVTWDRNRWMLGSNVGITKNAKLRFEYSINDEDIDHAAGRRLGDSPINNVDNNEFLIQLELKF